MSSTPLLTRSPWVGTASAHELARWRAVAERIADELRPGALDRDRTAAPGAALELLRELADLVIPVENGGQGAHWETAFDVVRTVSRADASLGQILGYHYLNQACVAFYGDPDGRERWYRRSAEQKLLWSDAFNPVSPDLSFVADADGYRLDGVKRFATGAAATDVVISGAIAEGGRYDGELVVFAFEARRAGVEHPEDWDHLGQRASASGSIRFTGVRITDADVIGVDRDEPFASLVTPGVQLLLANSYLAGAQAALEKARELVLARTNAWFLSGVERYADDATVHRVLGELVAQTAAVEALADRLARRFDEALALGEQTTAADRGRIEVEIAALKVAATRAALDVTSRVFEVTGASATANRVGLDLFWRNVRTYTLHDPVDYKSIEVGAHYLDGRLQPVSLYT